MVTYIYDGSFSGLLSAIYASYINRERPDRIIKGPEYQQSLVDRNVVTENNSRYAEKLMSMIAARISKTALQSIFHAFLSDSCDCGTIIYNYLDLGWKVGNKVHICLSDDNVLRLENLCRKVLSERHRMLGLIRFKLLKSSIYYGAMEPTYNITPILIPHFTTRLASQDWIIHDVKRGIAAMYNRQKWVLTEFAMEKSPDLHQEEKYYQELWRQYFDSISIKSKKNPSLQKRNMPIKYWKYLIELQPER